MSNEIEFPIVKKASEGDIKAFETLVTAYEKKVFNLCFRYLGSYEDAKDVSQEVFIKIYKSINTFNYTSTFSTWLFKVTYNACVDQLRKLKKVTVSSIDENESISATLEEKSLGPEEVYIAKESYSNVLDALNNLKYEYKVVIILKDIQGFSYNEISEITSQNMGTVKSRLSRARIALKKMLENTNEEKNSDKSNLDYKEQIDNQNV